MKSEKYTLNAADYKDILKVVLYTGVSAMLATLIAVMSSVDIPEQWVFAAPIVNILLVSLKKFVDGNIE